MAWSLKDWKFRHDKPPVLPQNSVEASLCEASMSVEALYWGFPNTPQVFEHIPNSQLLSWGFWKNQKPLTQTP